jgi:carbon-monoxide dehydrogenase medium subunit
MQVPAPFEYERATSVDHAIGLLERLGTGARLIAGGHSLLPMMKLRLVTVDYLIDINDLRRELAYVRFEPDPARPRSAAARTGRRQPVGTGRAAADGEEPGREDDAGGPRPGASGTIRIGALTRHRELLEDETLRRACPIFHEAERVIADPLVRNRGTIGGALCQADPSEDLTAVCTTLDASCVIRGPEGERVVSMTEFYRGPYETAVGPDEMLIEIRIPLRPGGSSAYEKVGRRAGDWAIVSCGAAVWLADGVITDVRVGLAAVGPNTTGIPAIAEALRGREPSEELYALAGAIAAEHCTPVTDQRGHAEYKRHLAAELTRRTLRRAVARAVAGGEELLSGDGPTAS